MTDGEAVPCAGGQWPPLRTGTGGQIVCAARGRRAADCRPYVGRADVGIGPYGETDGQIARAAGGNGGQIVCAARRRRAADCRPYGGRADVGICPYGETDVQIARAAGGNGGQIVCAARGRQVSSGRGRKEPPQAVCLRRRFSLTAWFPGNRSPRNRRRSGRRPGGTLPGPGPRCGRPPPRRSPCDSGWRRPRGPSASYTS